MPISRTEAGREVNPIVAGIGIATEGAANYIVPHYSEDGKITRRGGNAGGTLADSEAKAAMEKILSKYGQRIPIHTMSSKPPVAANVPVVQGRMPKKLKRRKKTEDTNIPGPAYLTSISEITPTEEAVPASQNIQIVFKLGSIIIKVVADAVLETDIGLALVFSNEQEVRFIPEKGSEITIEVAGKQIEAMYIGVTFSWYNSPQKVMVFVKSD